MSVLLFERRFATLVESGKKLQTIRARSKRQFKVGDKISLRAWAGKPYRSFQTLLRTSIIHEVRPIIIQHDWYQIGNLEHKPNNQFAIADGFRSWDEMRVWFRDNHGLPFEGLLIKWYYQIPHTESIVWLHVNDVLPNVDETVFVYFAMSSEPVWLGYLDQAPGDGSFFWRDVSGAIINSNEPITHWASMLNGPIKEGGE